MKRYDKNKYKRKFSSYKKTLLFFTVIFFSSVLLGAILERRGTLDAFFDALFPPFIKNASPYLVVALPFLLLFLAGATIYAPFLSTAVVCLAGMQLTKELAHSTLYPFFTQLPMSLFSSYFLISWATFVTLTAMRIFTDTGIETGKDIFTGTMFLARGFKGIFNFRYILSYILFFTLFTLPPVLMSIIKDYIVTLL